MFLSINKMFDEMSEQDKRGKWDILDRRDSMKRRYADSFALRNKGSSSSQSALRSPIWFFVRSDGDRSSSDRKPWMNLKILN